MDKPLKDWTLGDIKAECVARHAFSGGGCRCDCGVFKLGMCARFPYVWDLSEPPRFTEEEYRDMETLYHDLCLWDRHDCANLRRDENGDAFLDVTRGGSSRNLFPSLKSGETINIQDELRKAGRL